jgi:Na+-transporting NADH:ubiquinone oxidoreductase subunit C
MFVFIGGKSVSSSEQKPPKVEKSHNSRTMIFIIVICSSCALILAILASVLKPKQDEAKELDRSKQLMISASLLSPDGYFLVQEDNKYVPAIFSEKEQILIPSPSIVKAKSNEILKVYQIRIQPFLTDNEGSTYTFQEKGIDLTKYLEENKKDGFADLPLKLVYAILPNNSPQNISGSTTPIGYVIPINGMGLWDAIYGYLAIESNGDTVIGTTWYEQTETAGLGANISFPSWQKQFKNKVIFHKGATGTTDFARAPIGIVVVKGKVSEVYGSSPKSDSAVDGITGATLTGMGVTNAYRNVLEKYRPFLLKVHQENVSP